VNDDISKVKVADIPNHDVMVAGFPCEDYSVATTKKLSKGIGGKKGVLWWQLERILREKGKHSPNYFIFENVDRLLNSPASQRGRDFAIMLTCLNNLEYMVEWRVIDASTYGFPQRRKRVFFVGYKKGTKPYERFNGEKEKVVDWLSMEGIFAQGFPIKRLIEQDIVEIDPLPSRKDTLEERRRDVKKISDLFNKGKMKSPFLQSGLM
jgi:DNA (cytosine-5)-methyltransferase 1